MKQFLLFSCSIVLFFTTAFSQAPQKPTASEIHESIKKLNFLGTVLYVAAHPDDENTALISYFANDVKARTGYLSLTRGDGGQNLIGPEIRELLGVIRTQELVAARQTDGGEQFFSRANDFGYSKHPDETLAIWNKDEVLADVVWAIRNFKPDIIINRFNHREETFGTTHGHHTSSAVLSALAFDLAGDETKYPEQLKYVDVWQPKREFHNLSYWQSGGVENFNRMDKSKYVKIGVGAYYPAYGLSNNEISSLSRSMHKSQGFGITGTRGQSFSYLDLIKGDIPQDKNNIFEGVDTSWNRVEGGAPIKNLLTKVEQEFDFTNPAKSVPELIEAHKLIQKIKDEHWKTQKTAEIESIILACSGMFLEAVATTSSATVNSEIKVNIEAINRSQVPITLGTVSLQPLQVSEYTTKLLNQNIPVNLSLEGILPIDMEETSAYWLKEKGTVGMYKVDDQLLIGKPNTPRKLAVHFNLTIADYALDIKREVVYKYNDPVKGEMYKPFEIIPAVTVALSDKVIIFSDESPKEIDVTVRAGKENIAGKVTLNYPEGWSVTPGYHVVNIQQKGAEETVKFKIVPPSNQSEGIIQPVVEVNGVKYAKELIEIDYDHIPYQSVVVPSESKIVKLDLERKGNYIGYIPGAGDDIPASLHQIGYEVEIIQDEEINTDLLSKFDAVVLGVRAYNTNERIPYYQNDLHEYVKNGGTLLVQYNTSHQLKTEKVAPYALELSRDRVTDEHSEVTILEPNHEVIQYPNKITEKDFEGWVQERGLYFPSNWSDEFTPLLEMNDKNYPPTKGSLLIAEYGKGYFIYTGLSFFRELPAGVPGAFKLFANLLSVGKNEIEQ